jgi:hypothetical protein
MKTLTKIRHFIVDNEPISPRHGVAHNLGEFNLDNGKATSNGRWYGIPVKWDKSLKEGEIKVIEL